MPRGRSNWPPPEPRRPVLQDAVQISAWTWLSETPQPAASTNAPAAENLSIRLLFWSATQTFPPASVAMPMGQFNWPAPPPELPLWHVLVHVSNWLRPSRTPQP